VFSDVYVRTGDAVAESGSDAREDDIWIFWLLVGAVTLAVIVWIVWLYNTPAGRKRLAEVERREAAKRSPVPQALMPASPPRSWRDRWDARVAADRAQRARDSAASEPAWPTPPPGHAVLDVFGDEIEEGDMFVTAATWGQVQQVSDAGDFVGLVLHDGTRVIVRSDEECVVVRDLRGT